MKITRLDKVYLDDDDFIIRITFNSWLFGKKVRDVFSYDLNNEIRHFKYCDDGDLVSFHSELLNKFSKSEALTYIVNEENKDVHK